MERRCVIDAVSHISDDPAALLQGKNDPVLLRRVHAAKEIHVLYAGRERLIVHLLHFRAGHYADDREAELLADMPGHEFIIAGHHLDRHAGPGELC